MSNVTEIRTTLNLPAELAELVDDYWHNQRLSSRNEAIRELLTYALHNHRYDARPAPDPSRLTPEMIERIRVAQTKGKRP